jgi:hypothetical protein
MAASFDGPKTTLLPNLTGRADGYAPLKQNSQVSVSWPAMKSIFDVSSPLSSLLQLYDLHEPWTDGC